MAYNSRKKIVVVGGGPAGMMAAIRAAQLAQDVILLEKNPSTGKKLLLSGKGRCNLTNAAPIEEFFKRFSGSGEFLRDAFKKFSNQDLMDFFESRGLRLKVERQLRVFPESDSSASVAAALQKELVKNKVNIIFSAEVKEIRLKGKDLEAVLANGKIIPGDKVILSTGGASYRFTGSDGHGLQIAKKLGHPVVPLRPGLVPLKVTQNFIPELEGLTLKNIRLSLNDGKKKVVSEVGELVFSAFGISGPLVFTLSGKAADWLSEGKKVSAEVDLKPGLYPEQVDARILRELKINNKKSVRNCLKTMLPQRMIDCFLKLAKIEGSRNASQVTLAQRKALVGLFKGLHLDIAATLPLEEAMVTRGGVALKQINPRTMESRLVKNLYFCGEMIDIDADTGGFNLQAAFSTGYLAGESASKIE